MMGEGRWATMKGHRRRATDATAVGGSAFDSATQKRGPRVYFIHRPAHLTEVETNAYHNVQKKTDYEAVEVCLDRLSLVILNKRGL
jgi:hypothetical protein